MFTRLIPSPRNRVSKQIFTQLSYHKAAHLRATNTKCKLLIEPELWNATPLTAHWEQDLQKERTFSPPTLGSQDYLAWRNGSTHWDQLLLRRFIMPSFPFYIPITTFLESHALCVEWCLLTFQYNKEKGTQTPGPFFASNRKPCVYNPAHPKLTSRFHAMSLFFYVS